MCCSGLIFPCWSSAYLFYPCLRLVYWNLQLLQLNYLFLLSILSVFVEYKIVGWFWFSAHWMHHYTAFWHLLFLINQLLFLLGLSFMWGVVSLSLLFIFCFQYFDYECLGVCLFEFTLLEICCTSWICNFLNKIWEAFSISLEVVVVVGGCFLFLVCVYEYTQWYPTFLWGLVHFSSVLHLFSLGYIISLDVLTLLIL